MRIVCVHDFSLCLIFNYQSLKLGVNCKREFKMQFFFLLQFILHEFEFRKEKFLFFINSAKIA